MPGVRMISLADPLSSAPAAAVADEVEPAAEAEPSDAPLKDARELAKDKAHLGSLPKSPKASK